MNLSNYLKHSCTVVVVAWMVAACGDGSTKSPSTTTQPAELTDKQAVNETKLQFTKFQGYDYCAESYPKTCTDLPTAYVLPHEPGQPFRIVFFNNQDRNSTWAIFNYYQYDADAQTAAQIGQFQWRVVQGVTERKGSAKWGVPE